MIFLKEKSVNEKNINILIFFKSSLKNSLDPVRTPPISGGETCLQSSHQMARPSQVAIDNFISFTGSTEVAAIQKLEVRPLILRFFFSLSELGFLACVDLCLCFDSEVCEFVFWIVIDFDCTFV